MNSKNDPRYPPSPTMMMQRPYGADRRRSPSPGPPPVPYPAYDRYVPPRASPFYREPYTNSYRPPPDAWGPERPYTGSPPSPDRFRPPRHIDGEGWGRSTWRPAEAAPWADRRPPPPPPPETFDPAWGRPRRDIMAQPMFEPSDTWKQTHGVPTEVPDGDARDWSYDRFSPARDVRERSPERFPPRDYPPHYPPTDRFRRFSGPQEQREPPSYVPRSDSYRPQYEDRGPWSGSSYHIPGVELRTPRDQRPPTRESRFTPRSDFGERMRFSRERSAGVGSVHTSPLPSPIRTRPDRAAFGGHSRSASGSYPHSPTNKAHPRPSWDYDAAPQANTPPADTRSRSISQEVSYNQHNRDEYAPELNGWTNGRSYREPSAEHYVPAGYTHRTLSGSPQRDSQASSPRYVPSTPPRHDGDYSRPAYMHQPDAYDGQPVSSHEPRYAAADRATGQDSASQAPVDHRPDFGERHLAQRDKEEQSSAAPGAASNRPLASEHPHTLADSKELAVAVSERLVKVSADDEEMEAVEQSLLVSNRHATVSRDSSSPEPDIPLASLAKQSATARSSVSIPATPAPQSEPSSRGELAHFGKSLAPNIKPAAGEIMPLQDVLRAVVTLRLQHDRQTKEERVTPVLLDNLSKVDPPSMPTVSTPEDVIREVTTGPRKKERDQIHAETKQSLQVRFAQRQADLTSKVARLKDEYLGLHKQWLVHCSKLDDAAKAQALQEAAATAGRTTRRSLATMGDAVRSDLEMEQIIASLGNEEMTDANHLGAKNAAVIPDMISVTQGTIDYLFDDTNNEVEDPASYYAPTTGIDDWTEDEVAIFLEKFAEFPKQFGLIADFLPHKTAAQCVTFYYLHKNKHIDFRQVVARRATKRKRGGRKQKSNALLTDIRKRDEEAVANGTSRRRRPPPASTNAEPRRNTARRTVAIVQEEPGTGTPTPEPENEPRKRRRRAAPRTTAAEQDEGAEEADPGPKPKRVRKPRRPANVSASASATPVTATPLDTPIIPDGPESNPMEDVVPTQASSSRRSGSSSWSEEDKSLFLRLLSQHGDDFKRIAASMPNKTTVQVGAFYRANADAMGLDQIVANAPKRSPSPSTQSNGVWKQVTFRGVRQYQDTRTPVETYQHTIPSAGSSGASTPIPGFGTSGTMPYRPSAYETMQVPYAFTRALREEHGAAHGSGGSVGPGGGGEQPLASPSPFAPGGPLTTRFSSFPYRNFSPSHFTDNPAPSFSGVQRTYVQQQQVQFQQQQQQHHQHHHVHHHMQHGAGGVVHTSGGHAVSGHAQEIVLTTTVGAPPPHAWVHTPLQTTDDLVAYLEHRTRLAQQQ